MNYKEFFGNDKILITGASGFVGRNLYEKLKADGLNVTGTCFSKQIKGLVFCDLTNYNQAEELMKHYRFKYVFMLATKTYGAGIVRSNPNALVRENLYLNSNMLDLCYKYEVKKVLTISSSTVYQVSNKALAEEDLDLNKEPYYTYIGVGWVKRFTEKICKFYKQQGLNINIVRPTGIYGKYDKYEEHKSHYLPAIIKRVLEKQNPLVIWGSGNNSRDMIYIDDLIRDILKIFINHNDVEPINLCTGDVVSIKDIVNIVVKLCNYTGEVRYDKSKPDAIPFRALLRNKFDSLFGKENYKPLEKGIGKVIDWMKLELGVK